MRIGIDIGHSAVKAVQLDCTSRTPTLVASAIVPLRTPGVFDDHEAQRLADTMRRRGFNKTVAGLAVPAKLLLTSVLELPPESGQVPIRMLAEAEVARVNKLKPRSFEMCYWRLPVAPRAHRAPPAMAVTLSHESAESMVDPLARAGIEVASIDAWVFSVVRACENLVAPAPSLTAIVDLGSSAARIVLVSGATVVTVREINEAGLSQAIASIADAAGVEPSAAASIVRETPNSLPPEAATAIADLARLIAAELQTSFGYAAQQFPELPIVRIILVGAGAALPQIADEIHRTFAQPLKVVTPQCLVACDRHSFDSRGSTAFTLAIGVARQAEAA
jgi:Tfp pilus assembly PilM family ATPase